MLLVARVLCWWAPSVTGLLRAPQRPCQSGDLGGPSPLYTQVSSTMLRPNQRACRPAGGSAPLGPRRVEGPQGAGTGPKTSYPAPQRLEPAARLPLHHHDHCKPSSPATSSPVSHSAGQGAPLEVTPPGAGRANCGAGGEIP